MIQVPEGLALWKLLQLPGKGPLGLLYRLSQGIKGLMTKIIAILPQGISNIIPKIVKQNLATTQISLSTTLIPFTDIIKTVIIVFIC